MLYEVITAAIYGSRASNGVVQIWTKRGNSEKLEINVNTQLSVSEVRKTLPYNDVNLIWDGTDAVSTNSDGTPVKRYDYQDLIFKTAVGTKNYVSLSRAKGDTKYFFSASHFDRNNFV